MALGLATHPALLQFSSENKLVIPTGRESVSDSEHFLPARKEDLGRSDLNGFQKLESSFR